MTKIKIDKVYVVKFTVEGFSEFAYDQLRYDSCFPLTQQDVSEMVNRRDLRRVTLEARSHDQNVPTKDRWASFGWKVIDVSK